MSEAPAATVSVLVRTMGRASLARALRSVYEQALPVELLVLQAGAGLLPDLPPPPPGVRLLRIEGLGPLDRAAAANALLDRVRTPLALFLDDDDWLLPGHLQRLQAALEAHPEAPAAHAGVVCQSGDPGQPITVHTYDAPAPWADELLANRLPIHGVMFRTAVIQATPALRMPADLAQFEDWDFWLQLMARGGPFVHVPGVSAVYWLDAAVGSGHAQAPTRADHLRAFAARRVPQLRADDLVALIDRDAAREAAHVELQQRLAATRGDVELLQRDLGSALRSVDEAQAMHRTAQAEAARLADELQRHRREVEVLSALRLEHLRQLERLDGMLAALYASTSWRITLPLRWAGRALAALRSGRAGTWLVNVALALRQEGRRHGLLGLLRRAPHYLRHGPRIARVLAVRAPTGVDNPFAAAPRPAPGVALRLHPDLLRAAPVIDACVSVVIPTLNAGEELRWLLTKLRQQQGVREVEVVIVDSGSTDGTPALARELGAVVVEIPPSEFSHSHARNLGADRARGDWLLFMVQDAYPVGDRWVHGMLSYLQDHAAEGVVAASCAETSRSDSDLMYDCNVATHYRFLGCLHSDRIGQFTGADHMALRSQGQLSDVACMIGRPLFMQHRYRGDYAEDLDLGMRLIRLGHKVAMLASVKVVHSHNRPAYYYLKRSFVDVVFLVGLFDDFHSPPNESVAGLLRGAQQVAQALQVWLSRTPPADGTPLLDGVDAWLASLAAPAAAAGADAHASPELGDARLTQALAELLQSQPADSASPAAQAREQRQFLAAFEARVRHLLNYVASVHGPGDATLRRELDAALVKTFAATLGASLAFLHLDRRALPPDDPQRPFLDHVFATLKAGV